MHSPITCVFAGWQEVEGGGGKVVYLVFVR